MKLLREADSIIVYYSRYFLININIVFLSFYLVGKIYITKSCKSKKYIDKWKKIIYNNIIVLVLFIGEPLVILNYKGGFL